ncbi:MAG: preprotein translocase subunit SecA, partial [Clostridia bacterium]
MGLFSFLFNSDNSRSIKKLKKIADAVVSHEGKFAQQTDEQLKANTALFKERIKNGEKLDSILPEAYAVVREAAQRTLNMKHFYVQVMGGIALHQGRIAEMRTGEGKTLVSTLPTYLNALTGKGVHVVTVNEYLAKRDAEWMGKVHKFLGLTVGVGLSGMSSEEKRAAYACDITYCTNNELGFDYLRDNMAIKKEDRVQRGHNFAVVDEVDSILIDEARTPLIISGRGMKSSSDYVTAQNFVKNLKKDEDFEIEIKHKAINLTANGIEKAEKFYKVENLSDVGCIEINHHIINALKANHIMALDENYIVKDGEIIIVDEFTGRLMAGRRYSDGLHQAIEAKEGVKIKDENKTLATITFQNYFRLYKKLSGMTGTAKTEEVEFNNIYKLDVVTIPTNLPSKRKDEPDIIYTTIAGKTKAIVNEIIAKHKIGQPVLVGTITIEKSEELSKELKKAKIPHNILNAKNHEQESEIVAQAGRFGAVTIATNMAGRGTDILLGGNPEFMAKKKMKEDGINDLIISLASAKIVEGSSEVHMAAEKFREYYKDFKTITDKEKEEVIKAGGLHILGTERHESRRIDNQLRGRSGRQGDIGSSVFFISLEDDLAKRFGGDKMKSIATLFKIDEETPFQLKMLSSQIEKAQKRIEAYHFGARRAVLQFDEVLNTQRNIIYGERNKVLDGEDVHTQIMEMFPDIISKIVEETIDADKPSAEWDLEKINSSLELKLFPKGTNFITAEMVEECDLEEIQENILTEVCERYEKKVLDASEINFNFADFERYILLRVVDTLWMDHIDQMSILKNEIGLQAYGNHDPIVAYKREGFEMFDNM